jgi:multisubunit Na+/H+ antiporter MnhB subunit
MTSAEPRPRIVEVAFWCWVVAAVLLILGGLLAVTTGFDTLRHVVPATVADDKVRSLLTIYRATGAICIALGLAFGYLAGRTRRGDKRFRRAAIALSVAAVVLLVLCAVLLGYVPYLAPFATIALMVAAVLATRDKAQAWFDAVDSGRKR